MTRIIKLTFNAFQENTYIIYNASKECWIIDPGNSNPKEDALLLKTIQDHQLKPVELILTHAHIDHVLGNHWVYKEFGLAPLMHEIELQVLSFASMSAARWNVAYTESPAPKGFLKEGTTIQLGEDKFQILFTPGHSPGSICFYNEADKYCISGDVLFQSSIGRTDLPGGDYDTLIASIQTQLMVLPDDVDIHSGHGPSTTIGRERKMNPFL
jgi:glyoxylase-like metal-dependent hydrolase (beta-lactamase superfamily II)